MKYLDRIANIAVLVAVAVFLAGFFGKQWSFHKYPTSSAKALVGKSVALPQVDFGKNQVSFVLALSTSCRFCKDSLPFYKRLADESKGRADVIAVLPQSLTAGEEYIRNAGISSTRVVSGDLNSVGVYATPTVLLVNHKGEVQNAWVGMLDDKTQQQVLAHVQPN